MSRGEVDLDELALHLVALAATLPGLYSDELANDEARAALVVALSNGWLRPGFFLPNRLTITEAGQTALAIAETRARVG